MQAPDYTSPSVLSIKSTDCKAKRQENQNSGDEDNQEDNNALPVNN